MPSSRVKTEHSIEIHEQKRQDMKALVLRQHGEITSLELDLEHPVPEVKPGFAVIKVTASSFNYHDIFTVRGMPGITIPFPVVIGLDVVGTIAELPEGTDTWRLGDRVLVHPIDSKGNLIGEVIDGGMAQYALVELGQLIAIPDAVTDYQAAALPVAYGTAHRMIVGKAAVHAGDKVLVLGASGGVGTASVILAKKQGAYVIAAVGDDDKGQKLLDAGADEVFNYRNIGIAQYVKEKHGKPSRFDRGPGMDVVVNFTGGDTWQETLRATGLGGRILVCGATAGFAPQEDLRYIWSFEQQIIGSNGFDTEDFVALLEGIAAGAFEPIIDSVVPLEQARNALQRLENREFVGKIIVDPWLGLNND